MSDKPIEALSFTGRTLYVVRHNPDGTVWNANTEAWEVYNASNWTSYAIAMTEQAGSGYYRAAQTIADLDVLTTDCVYIQIGPSPDLGTDTPGVGIGQSQGSDVFSIGGSVLGANNLAQSAISMEQGIVQAGSNTVAQIVADLDSAEVDAYRGRVVIFTSGDDARVAAIIKSFDPITKILGFTEIPAVPAVDDTFIVV